jgi:hypothetical protein
MNKWLKGKFTCQNPKKYKGDAGNITYRSSWERTFMVWCDTEPDILAWGSEEIAIWYFDPIQNKKRKYMVDFQIVTRKPDGQYKVTMIEIKPYKQTVKPRATRAKSEKTILSEQTTWLTNQAKWRAAIEFANQKGWCFKIITERELFGGIDRGFKPQKPSK